MTELEKKMLVSKEEYEYLMERFGYESPWVQKPIIKQINYYFDTDDYSMNKKNITCRIRLKDGKLTAIMKEHSPQSDCSTESKVEIYGGLKRNAFTDMGLKLQGSLSTVRCIILKDFNCEVALDKNMYLDHEDYELEIEYTPEYEKNAASILRIFKDILLRRKHYHTYKESFLDIPHVPSKSGRFFERKEAIDRSSKEDNKADVTNNESIPKTETISSHLFIDRFDYSDPDDYMHDYLGSIMPEENVCLSCVHFTGAWCQSPYGSCEYEPF